MMAAQRAVLCVVLGSVGVLLCSCGVVPLPGGRTCDQGCSSVALATGKILANNLAALNPDDVQVLTDLAIQISGVNIPAVTNEQAAAVISFLQANGITTIESLQAVIAEAQTNPDAVVIPQDVLDVLEALAANPEAYEAATAEFGG